MRRNHPITQNEETAALHRRVMRAAQGMYRTASRLGRNHPHTTRRTETGVPTGLVNDEGAAVSLGTECYDTYYCNRLMGLAAMPGSDGRCGPQNGPQCLSCGRLQDEQRFSILQRQFPTITDDALVAALREGGGVLHSAHARLVELGATARPDPLVVEAMTRSSGFPRAMVEMALLQTGCLISEAETWLYGEMESCFRAAAQQSGSAGSLESTSQADPAPISFLREAASSFLPITLTHGDQERVSNRYTVVKGHRMVRVDRDEPFRCVLCCSNGLERASGDHRCRICNLCEGCVQSDIVFCCPALPNGSHLHHHPLQFGASKLKRCCDIGGDGCVAKNSGSNGNVTWRCSDCDFDICPICIKGPAPEGYNRRTSESLSSAEGPDLNAQLDDGLAAFLAHRRTRRGSNRTQTLSFDEIDANRDVTERWQTHLRHNRPRCRVIVNTGTVETRIRARSSSRLRLTPVREHLPLPSFSILDARAMDTLEQFKSVNRGPFSATDLTFAEDFLRRAQAIKDSTLRDRIQNAIVARSFGIAGTLLLSSKCTMISGKDTSGSTTTCWCGDEIDHISAPNGTICCLAGHAMHPSCAADLLLSGKNQCPTCREALFFARLAESEIVAATATLLDQKKGEDLRDDDPSCSTYPLVGDLVRITDDKDFCRSIQNKSPMSGGWYDDMVDSCGLQGVVSKVHFENNTAVAVRVQAKTSVGQRKRFIRKQRKTNRCPSCLRQSHLTCTICAQCEICCGTQPDQKCDVQHEWAWDPSLIVLVKRMRRRPLSEPTIEDVDEVSAKRKSAERQLVQLRAELAAVKKAREDAGKELIELSSRVRASCLSSMSTTVLSQLRGILSPADYQWAHHLLFLAEGLGTFEKANLLQDNVRADVLAVRLEAAARRIRLQYAFQTCEKAIWDDAAAQTANYVVKPFARVQLLAFPALGTPKTGFNLEPGTHFSSACEMIGKDGCVWLQVGSPHAQGSERSIVYRDSDPANDQSLLGKRVKRGKDWRNGDEDGGLGNEGVIIAQAGCNVVVEWNGIRRNCRYRVGERDPVVLEAVDDVAPHQGWLCLCARGVGSALVAVRTVATLKCSCCGSSMNQNDSGTERFEYVDISRLRKGDRVLVAATLESVCVESVAGDRVCCSFPHTEGLFLSTLVDCSEVENGTALASERFAVWYTARDLVTPQKSSISASYSFDETRLVGGFSRSRRELVLMNDGDVEKAKKLWEEASEPCDSTPFASCLMGHLLDARCFEAALLSGTSCPVAGCSEPLWVPPAKTTGTGRDADACNGDAREASQTLQVAENVGSPAEDHPGDGESPGFEQQGNLKMCPCCCSGPLVNEYCAAMSSHHGECTAVTLSRRPTARDRRCTDRGIYRAPASEIAQALTRVSNTRTVTDVLPRCPTHNVAVMFNGCLSCGHLFDNWNLLPAFDVRGKEKLDCDKKRMAAARLISAQVREEAGMLEYVQRALWELQSQAREK